MRKILFICTGKTCRSPMAEGLLNHLAESKALQVQAISAGLHVSETAANDKAISAAAEHDVDLSHHVPQQLDDALVGEVDLLLTMEGWQKEAVAADFPQARDKVHTLLEFAGKQGNVGDPIDGSLDDYRDCARQVMQAIQGLVDKLSRIEKPS
ncbi:MAG TPA: low molecular weight protein arginine phosphatase [Anaerolineae bacterium]|nr:low molecular weight protein arginine phosphatase [Anaerolineae bacterium]